MGEGERGRCGGLTWGSYEGQGWVSKGGVFSNDGRGFE